MQHFCFPASREKGTSLKLDHLQSMTHFCKMDFHLINKPRWFLRERAENVVDAGDVVDVGDVVVLGKVTIYTGSRAAGGSPELGMGLRAGTERTGTGKRQQGGMEARRVRGRGIHGMGRPRPLPRLGRGGRTAVTGE